MRSPHFSNPSTVPAAPSRIKTFTANTRPRPRVSRSVIHGTRRILSLAFSVPATSPAGVKNYAKPCNGQGYNIIRYISVYFFHTLLHDGTIFDDGIFCLFHQVSKQFNGFPDQTFQRFLDIHDERIIVQITLD